MSESFSLAHSESSTPEVPGSGSLLTRNEKTCQHFATRRQKLHVLGIKRSRDLVLTEGVADLAVDVSVKELDDRKLNERKCVYLLISVSLPS